MNERQDVNAVNHGKEHMQKKGNVKRIHLVWIAVIVCLILALLCTFAYLFASNTAREEPAQVYDGFFYNDAELLGRATDEPIGWFEEELTPEEIAALLPNQILENMKIQVFSHYSAAGHLQYVKMPVSTSVPDEELEIWAMESFLDFEYRGEGKPVISKCGDVLYTLYRDSFMVADGMRVVLAAAVTVDGVDWSFSFFGNERWEEQMKAELESVLTHFAQDFPTGDEITGIQAKSEPVEYTKVLTWKEAIEDEEFGAYLPKSLAEDFSTGGFIRNKTKFDNSLNSIWEQGNAVLNWNIHYEGNMSYPGFPAFLLEELTLEDIQESVTYKGSSDNIQLRESNIDLTVKSGEIIIFIYSRYVEPETIYNHLMTLRNE